MKRQEQQLGLTGLSGKYCTTNIPELGGENIRCSLFFENLPKMIRPQKAAELLGLSTETIYDWKYRAKLKRVPEGLFIKLNRTLYLRTDVLKEWITSQNPSLQ